MSARVGDIDLNLNVNRSGFQRQMNGITGMAKKAGAAIAAAFAVKGLVDFGKKALELGSDLAEVQNVVDVTFTSMSKSVNEFAQNAATSFGLSETMAKKYMGTFGAMSKAFGFSEQQAFDMGTALTGLAGDVASFYNLSQDEAYTKLKSVFTGETESLKDLGVVMTQSALDAYALANGFGKTTQQMSEMEKVALRYKFVQDQLSLASGDFMRTSDGWANQIRILKLQFESFMGTVGQGLINILTPVLKVLNELLKRLIEVAKAFKAFTESVFGKNSTGDGAKNATSDLTDMSNAATDAVEESAEKSKKATAGFDTLNVLSDNSAKTGAADAGIDLGGNTGTVASPEDEMTNEVGGMAARLQTFFGDIKAGFESLRKIYDDNFAPLFEDIAAKTAPQIERFKQTLKGMFSDIGTLGEPFKAWASGNFIPFLQQLVKTAGEIGVGLFDSFNMVFSDIWTRAVYPLLQNFLTTVLPVLTDVFTKVIAVAGHLFNEIKNVFDLIWSTAIAPALSLIVKIWTEVWGVIKDAWDKWGQPIFEGIKKNITNVANLLKNIWTTVIQPIWEGFMDAVDWLWTGHLKPLLANLLDFFGELWNFYNILYDRVIYPILNFLVDLLGPSLVAAGKLIIDVFASLVAVVADMINGIITSLKGLVQIATGILTGDWSKAWEGMKNVVKGALEGMMAPFKGVINVIIDLLNYVINMATNAINFFLKGANKAKDIIPGGGTKRYEMMQPYKIPKLAAGAVIPPNREFLAVLGDQKNGTNIEAPLSTIMQGTEQAVRKVMGSGGYGGSVTIPLFLNDREFARATASGTAGEFGRRGVRLINGVT